MAKFEDTGTIVIDPGDPIKFRGDEIWEPKPTSPVPMLNPKGYVEEIKKALNSYYGQENVSKYPKIEYISCNPEPSYSISKLAREYADQLDAYRYAVGYLDKLDRTSYDAEIIARFIDGICRGSDVAELCGKWTINVNGFDRDPFGVVIPVVIKLKYKENGFTHESGLTLYLSREECERSNTIVSVFIEHSKTAITHMIEQYKKHKDDYLYKRAMEAIMTYTSADETTYIDISKGENEMAKTEAQIRYEEKCNEAKKAYDEALRIAREELDAAEQKKTCDNAASMMKDLYDSYVEAGFSEEQAMKFVTIALEKGK